MPDLALLLDMNEQRRTAFAFAQETTKQLIALSTGVIALTITFFQHFATNAGPLARLVMAISWVLYLLSIVFGLVALMALTGSLEPKEPSSGEPSIRGRNVTGPATAQIVLFLAGLAVTVVAGIFALFK